MKKTPPEVLQPKQIESFLTRLANLRESNRWQATTESARALQKRFPELLALADSTYARAVKDQTHPDLSTDQIEQLAEHTAVHLLYKFAPLLRAAWDEPDSRLRDWQLYELRRLFHDTTAPDLKGEPPLLTPFERAIHYFQRNADRAHHCANPDCPAPYFIAKDRKTQKYCDPKCAGPAKKEAKRQWWEQNKSRFSGRGGSRNVAK